MCGLSAVFGQLRVSNNFGQTLIITINGQTRRIPDRGTQSFSVNNPQVVQVGCKTLDGKISFSTSKSVLGGSISIEPKDNRTSPQAGAASIKSPQSPPQGYRTVPGQGDKIALVYRGEEPFKIFSEIGRGLEYVGTDTINNKEGKNRYIVFTPKNQDLIIGIGMKTGEANQAIWPYAEIRKRINSGDTVCYITQRDIKKMSTGEKKNLRIRLIAEKYKIFFEPSDSKESISLGFRGISKTVEVPIGQFYIKISFTDPDGMFHSTVFVPKHVTQSEKWVHMTESEKFIEITKSDLDNAIQLNW
ncbi:MAG: hypothetical protein NTY31_02235 [Candidatus Falkowbacteria bacterium]|nr:hypothetical protein [Candidatus Falkowbacteria bacterium]